MQQQAEEKRGAEEEADILVAPISLLLVDAEMVLTANFQNASLPDLTALGPVRNKKPFASQHHNFPQKQSEKPNQRRSLF
jgi:hypothetical protein